MDDVKKNILKKIDLVHEILEIEEYVDILYGMEDLLADPVINKDILIYLSKQKLPIDSKQKIISIYEHIAAYFLQKDDTEAGIKYLKQALEIAKNKTNERQKAQLGYQRLAKRLSVITDVIIHDFNASLGNIQSAINLFKANKQRRVTPEVSDCLMLINENIDKLNNKLKSITRYGHTGIVSNPPQAINLHQVIIKVKDNLENEINLSETTIVTKKLPKVLAHFVPIRELFQELIHNAVKFKKNDQPLRICIQNIPQSHSEDFHQFEICDNGIGIEERLHERIFLPLRKLKIACTDIQSQGIGLAICQKIVKGYGGKIWVDSEFGKGSCFYFTLPKFKEY